MGDTFSDTFLNSANAAYLEDILRQYKRDPGTVEPSWRAFFEGEGRHFAEGPPPQNGPAFQPTSIFRARSTPSPSTGNGLLAHDQSAAQERIATLVNAYRAQGHFKAELDPLGLRKRTTKGVLNPATWGFTEADMDRTFSTASLYGGGDRMTLRALIDFLEETYARSIGAEFMHIGSDEERSWLMQRCEATRNRLELDRETQLHIFSQLCDAETFEEFLQIKFLGAKRFSLEGGEALIPLISLLIEESAGHGVRDIVIGMPHRGRLNILANVFHKDRKAIFKEFLDDSAEVMFGRGDVKYHLGHSHDFVDRKGRSVHLSLTFNPSHLEAINPVVAGRVRAKQDRAQDSERRICMPILLHGDAAFPGQGLVSETLNLMNLEGYRVGGTIHIIVNNQIGFTTLPHDSRSSSYCTDIAKMIEVPIFHVNGHDPEAVAQVVQIAAEYRQTFGKDFIIDMYCFRRYGHNEADEPKFTQPLMYDAIEAHPHTRSVYAQKLTQSGLITAEELDNITQAKVELLERDLQALKDGEPIQDEGHGSYGGVWKGYFGGWEADVEEVDTFIDDDLFDRVVTGITSWPDTFEPHPKIKRLLKTRSEASNGKPINWGTGECIAYGSLLMQGHRVRFTGQDSPRGTFSHRHATLIDRKNSSQHVPLAHLSEDQGPFEIFNSPLSEAAVLGFEYGYALDTPNALVIWEAQFGDFANGAQVIIDQFLSAGEDKWERINGVTLFLPHGFEGMGPEHSSARFERYLQLCAEDNMQICNITTPANLFHCLRRQVVRPWRKPLVIMTPKSLLRHKHAVSLRSEFTSGGFQRVIPDTEQPPEQITRAILCTGKIYYELLEHRENLNDTTTAIIRIEQLYPFPDKHILAAIEAYTALTDLVWCQEEPENMGPFTFLYHRFDRLFTEHSVRYVTREASGSPASGSKHAHKIEQDDVLNRAFCIDAEPAVSGKDLLRSH